LSFNPCGNLSLQKNSYLSFFIQLKSVQILANGLQVNEWLGEKSM
jgi:hypothetical protein